MSPAPKAVRPPDKWTPEEQLSFFFAPPVPYQRPKRGYRSTLHLLRRELQDCLVGEHMADEDAPVTMHDRHRRVFATALVIWSGIDLLAKFHAGDPSGFGVGRKFKKYVTDLMVPNGGISPGLESTAGKILYEGMRNPMMHAFRLDAEAFDVVLEAASPPTHVIHDLSSVPNTYDVNLSGLYRVFVRSIRAYQTSIQTREDRARFVKVFRQLGYIASTGG